MVNVLLGSHQFYIKDIPKLPIIFNCYFTDARETQARKSCDESGGEEAKQTHRYRRPFRLCLCFYVTIIVQGSLQEEVVSNRHLKK